MAKEPYGSVSRSHDEHYDRYTDKGLSEYDEEKRDLVFAYILISADSSYITIVRKM